MISSDLANDVKHDTPQSRVPVFDLSSEEEAAVSCVIISPFSTDDPGAKTIRVRFKGTALIFVVQIIYVHLKTRTKPEEVTSRTVDNFYFV